MRRNFEKASMSRNASANNVKSTEAANESVSRWIQLVFVRASFSSLVNSDLLCNLRMSTQMEATKLSQRVILAVVSVCPFFRYQLVLFTNFFAL